MVSTYFMNKSGVLEGVLSAIKKQYQGPVIMAEDAMVIEVKKEMYKGIQEVV